jgi:hypothetical protein
MIVAASVKDSLVLDFLWFRGSCSVGVFLLSGDVLSFGIAEIEMRFCVPELLSIEDLERSRLLSIEGVRATTASLLGKGSMGFTEVTNGVIRWASQEELLVNWVDCIWSGLRASGVIWLSWVECVGLEIIF